MADGNDNPGSDRAGFTAMTQGTQEDWLTIATHFGMSGTSPSMRKPKSANAARPRPRETRLPRFGTSSPATGTCIWKRRYASFFRLSLSRSQATMSVETGRAPSRRRSVTTCPRW